MRRPLLVFLGLLVVTNIVTYVVASDSQTETRQPTEEIDVQEPIATVAGDTIYYDEWLDDLEVNYGREGLNEMIDRRVVSELADEHNMSINERVIDLEVAYLATLSNQLPEGDVERIENSRREDVEHRLLTEKLITRDIDISDAEVEDYYQQYQSQYNFSERVELSHIVVDDSNTANRVYQELEEGASFYALAAEYTTDEDSRSNGGYLGFYTESNSTLPSGYFEQAVEVGPYQYTEPFQQGSEYVILKAHRHLPSIDLDLDDLREHIRLTLAIEEMEKVPEARDLWAEVEVETIY
ncbi:Parvulin-like peptidyl-prolyl isomerase [Pelagirhabdus alkalitolerans]|uniref:peptidylprolyl isomerase n=1 Tax=Pelagirhabdus alkalitolerans TaxID=1612202 RepID=A0A1G6MGH2_9BACI|nr:peptidyl-prolyl cis-trans isomerase [Pelagirhabdus alkalitolerans]SDC54580.1 Parvulin-like peptidyl-prolyl isomerase [Pelagirhabdus alkalitolerans]